MRRLLRAALFESSHESSSTTGKLIKGGSGVRARVLGCVLGRLLVLEVGPALVLRELRVAAHCLVLDEPGRGVTPDSWLMRLLSLFFVQARMTVVGLQVHRCRRLATSVWRKASVRSCWRLRELEFLEFLQRPSTDVLHCFCMRRGDQSDAFETDAASCLDFVT